MAGTPSPDNRLNETTADSGAGEGSAGDGVHDARPPHRHRLAARGVPAHAQGRGGGRGRTDGGGVRGATWRTTSGRCSTAPSPARTGRRPCGGCTSRRGRTEDAAHRHPDVRGQGPPAGGGMVLEAVYEQDFLDCSYGFRPGRSAHQALEALWHEADGDARAGGSWRSTSESSSTLWTTAICTEFFARGYVTACCCD